MGLKDTLTTRGVKNPKHKGAQGPSKHARASKNTCWITMSDLYESELFHTVPRTNISKIRDFWAFS